MSTILPSGGIASPLTTKGDLYSYSSANARLPVGSDSKVVTARSTAALGIDYETDVIYDAQITSTGALAITVDGNTDLAYDIYLDGYATNSGGDGWIGFLLNNDSGANYTYNGFESYNGATPGGFTGSCSVIHIKYLGYVQGKHQFALQAALQAKSGQERVLQLLEGDVISGANSLTKAVTYRWTNTADNLTSINLSYNNITALDCRLTIKRRRLAA
jgi:hypothetical protein